MTTAFFSDNYDAITRFQEALTSYVPSDEKEVETVAMLKVALSAISFSREEYDQLAPYTARVQGRGFLDVMHPPFTKEKLQRALLYLASFIREASLVRESRMHNEQVVLDYFLGESIPEDDSDWGGYHGDYLRYVLPSRLLETQYSGIGRLRDNIQKLQAESADKTDELEKRIQGYRDELKRLASEFNFVGLSDAFKKLFAAKNVEKHWQFGVIVVLGLVSLAVPAYFLLSLDDSLLGTVLSTQWAPNAIGKLIAAIGLEVVILYFFRVALRTYLTTRSQMTNLQLRLSLCSFIEGYLEFAGKAANAKSGGALSGFEDLIFGPLPSEGPALPATLEGLEQVSAIVQAARK